MTASQQAKAAGLKSLLQVQQITKQSAQTLINWHRDKPDLFRVVIAGCVSITPAKIADNERLEKMMIDFTFRDVPKKEWPLTFTTPVRVFKSCKFLVQEYEEKNNVIRLSILNIAKDKKTGTWTDGISWDDLQKIKSSVGYGDMCAVEVYPEDDNVVNVAAIRHLFILPIRPDFAWLKQG